MPGYKWKDGIKSKNKPQKVWTLNKDAQTNSLRSELTWQCFWDKWNLHTFLGPTYGLISTLGLGWCPFWLHPVQFPWHSEQILTTAQRRRQFLPLWLWEFLPGFQPLTLAYRVPEVSPYVSGDSYPSFSIPQAQDPLHLHCFCLVLFFGTTLTSKLAV